MFMVHTLQWAVVKQSSNKSLAKVIDKEGSYNFWPYVYPSGGFIGSSYSRRTSKRSV